MTQESTAALNGHRGRHQGRRDSDELHRQRIRGVAQGHDRPRHGGRRRGRDDVPQDDRGAVSRPHDPGGGIRRGCGHARRVALLGVRSDRRHQQLRARPADFLLVAGARDRRQGRDRRHLRSDAERAVRRRARRRRVPERPADSCVERADPGGVDARDGISVRHPRAASRRLSDCSASSSARRAPCGASGRPRSISATWRPDAWTGSGSRI